MKTYEFDVFLKDVAEVTDEQADRVSKVELDAESAVSLGV